MPVSCHHGRNRKGEGAPGNVVRGWLAKALTAPRGPQWVCDKCNTIHAEWVPLCTNCQALTR